MLQYFVRNAACFEALINGPLMSVVCMGGGEAGAEVKLEVWY